MARLQFLGSGDAFGSGGRFQTCFHITASGERFLVDCGSTALIAMRRYGVEPNDVSIILLSHLHGDHFGGLPYFLLDAQLVSRRSDPLTIVGPPGTRERIDQAMEVNFPGSTQAKRRFELDVVEIPLREPTSIGGLRVTTFPVKHPSGAPSTALRIECGGKTLAYSGDTEWTDTLIEAARDADLFICECYMFDKQVPFHLNLKTIRERKAEIGARRIVLTHMSADMLKHLGAIEEETAVDGGVIEF